MKLAKKYKDQIKFNKSINDRNSIVFYKQVWYNVIVEADDTDITFTIEANGTEERLSHGFLVNNDIAYKLKGVDE